jgi:hypothetical protein
VQRLGSAGPESKSTCTSLSAILPELPNRGNFLPSRPEKDWVGLPMTSFFLPLLALFVCAANVTFSQGTYLVAGDKTSPGLMYTAGDLSDTLQCGYFPGDTMHLDMDANGSIDFILVSAYHVGSSPYSYLKISGLSGNLVSEDAIGETQTYSYGDTIFSTDPASASAALRGFEDATSLYYGNFPIGDDSSMLGVKIVSGGSEQLGWIRVRSDPSVVGYFGLTGVVLDYVVGYSALSVAPEPEQIRFELFPNPATSTLHLATSESGDWDIVDLQGRTLLEQNQRAALNADISSLSPGMYFVRLTTQRGTTVKRFVKE